MDDKKIKRVEITLRKAMERAIVKGWAPMPGLYTSDTGTCCLLGSLFVDDVVFADGYAISGTASFHESARRLGIHRDEAMELSDGFGSDVETGSSSLYSLAQRLRRDYYVSK